MHFVLFDRDGVIVDRGMEMQAPHLLMNEVEKSLRTYIGADGRYSGVPYNKNKLCNLRSEKEDNAYCVVISGKVVSVDVAGGVVRIDALIGKGKQVLDVKVGAWTRVESGARPAVVKDFKPGDEVVALAWVGGMFGREAVVNSQGTWALNVSNAKAGLKARLDRNMYNPVYPLKYFIQEMEGVKEVPATRLAKGASPQDPLKIDHAEMLDGDRKKGGWTEMSHFVPQYMDHVWFCGVVKELDLDRRLLTVAMNPTKPEDMHGYAAWKKQKNEMILSVSVRKKMELVDSWMARPPAERVVTFLLDAATALTLNGRDIRDPSLIKLGDKVAVEWPLEQADAKLPRPDVVRISRMAGARQD